MSGYGTLDSDLDASMKSTEEIPSLKLSTIAQLPYNTNFLACSDDGRFLSLGHSQGLSVWCASSLSCVADWLQDSVEITAVQITRMAEAAYLVSTVDDMGVARVFAYQSNTIHLLSVINSMEDVNKRSICLTFELSEGGHYGAASFSCNTLCWLTVYHFPLKAWLKELAVSQAQDSNSSGSVSVKWSPFSVETKINPPKFTGTGLEDHLDVFQTTDVLSHCLALDAEINCDQMDEQSLNAGKTKETTESPKYCTHHFLLSCGQFPSDSKSMPQQDLPVAVCLWWSGSYNLLQYVLQRTPTKKKTNEESMPDVLLPNAKKILCSAVSRCTRFIALGLDDALMCVWDRQSGSPLSVLLLATSSVFSGMHFVDYWPVSTDDSKTFTAAQVNLFVTFKSGAIYTVTIGRGVQSCASLLTERPKDSRDLPFITTSVPFLQCLMLVVQRNGKMYLQNIINHKTVCFLIAPRTHLSSTPCKPVYSLNSKQQTLFIRGDQVTSSTEDNRRLFVFHFGQSEFLKQYIVSHSAKQKTLSFATLEETCNLYLQQRALSVHERNKAVTQTWKQLQESEVTMQQRDSRDAAS